jgi:hypothetical protein
LVAIHHFGLLQSLELDICWRTSVIVEGPSNGVQVVGSDGHKSPLSAEVVVEFVLDVQERPETVLRERDVP